MNRQEHLEWSKARALEYVEIGDLDNAFNSMMSDLCKHDELKEHPGIMLGASMWLGGLLLTVKAMRDFINGFN